MRKLILFILLSAITAYAGQGTWNAGTTHMDVNTNYTPNLTNPIAVTDSADFTNGAVGNATMFAAISIGSIYIHPTYSGVWNMSTFGLTINGTCFIDSGVTGTHTYGAGGITIAGNSTRVLLNPGGTFTTTACPWTFNGTTGMVFYNSKAPQTYKSWVLGASADSFQIYNNTCIVPHQYGGGIKIYGDTTIGNKYDNNTVYFDSAHGVCGISSTVSIGDTFTNNTYYYVPVGTFNPNSQEVHGCVKLQH